MTAKRTKMATKNFNLAKLARNINIQNDGSIAFSSEVSAGTGGETIGSLTASMDSDQTTTITLTTTSTPVPIVQAYKEVPQVGISAKGQWNVNANATNYDFYDEKPYSTYASATLTPSATGDGTFTSSSMIIGPTDIDNLTYDNKSINITSLNHTGTGTYGDLKGFYIKPDGTKLFSLSTAGIVSEHVLSTAYDISTTTYNNVDTSALTTETSAAFDTNLALSPDGTKLFVLQSATKEIARYDLSTAWDLSTLSTTKHSYYIEAANFNTPISFTFNADGTVLIIFYNSTDDIVKYDLSTAWDLSTASRASFTIVANSSSSTAYVGSTLGIDLHSLEFTNNGNVLLGSDYAQQKIYQWNLTSPYSITSTSLVYDTQFSITLLAGNNVSYGPGPLRVLNGKAYIVDGGSKSIIYQYTSSASNVFNSSDVGKKVVGNSGSAIITSAAGAYKSVTAFADTSAISSWQLFGAQGKSDGSGIELTASSNGYDLANASYTSTSFNTSTQMADPRSVRFKLDGTKMYVTAGNSTGDIYQYSLSTPYDLTTISYDGTMDLSTIITGFSNGRSINFNSDGTKAYVSIITGSSYHDTIFEIDLSTAWDTRTASYNSVSLLIESPNVTHEGVAFKPDGTKFWTISRQYDKVYAYTMTTAWDLSTASYDTVEFSVTTQASVPYDLYFKSDGTKMYILDDNDSIYEYDLSTAWDITTSTYNNISFSLANETISPKGIFMDANGLYLFAAADDTETVYKYSIGSITHPYSQYVPALTNSSTGQINSSTWLDINSMTADETKNDGDIFYAVSTDNRTSWGVAKGSDGVRKIAKNNSGTWQYNNDAGSSVSVGFGLSSPSYDNKSYTVPHSNPRGMYLKSDGTELYIGAYTGHVYQYTLSTPNDISTASSTGNYNIDEVYDTVALTFKPDGTKMYATGGTVVYQYTLSTAWDITTASYDSVSYTPSDMGSSDIHSLNFNSDGTKLFMSDDGTSDRRIREYTLSTPYVISSASTTSNYLYHAKANVRGVDFNSDGTKIFLSSYSTQFVYQYNLASAYTLSSSQGSTADAEYDATSTISSSMYSIAFSNDGTKLFILESSTPSVKQFSTTSTTIGYGTGETWVNGTNNNEHATLQEALGAQSFNRMNKAQLDAIADANHFSQDSADTLDLMIAPYAASGTSPISDGVTINYDAASKYRQAVPETDYRADFVGNNKLEFTSNISANFKVKVL